MRCQPKGKHNNQSTSNKQEDDLEKYICIHMQIYNILDIIRLQRAMHSCKTSLSPECSCFADKNPYICLWKKNSLGSYIKLKRENYWYIFQVVLDTEQNLRNHSNTYKPFFYRTPDPEHVNNISPNYLAFILKSLNHLS